MNITDIFKKEKTKDFLVIEFGSGAVRSLIFGSVLGRNTLKRLESEKIERFGVFDSQQFEKDVISRALRGLVEKLGGRERINKYQKLISFPPGVLRADLLELKFKKRNDKEKISKEDKEKIENIILQRAEEKFLEKIKRENPEAERFVILEKRIIGRKAAGYKVNSIERIASRNFDFKVLIIFTGKEHLWRIDYLKEIAGFHNFSLFHQVEGLYSFLNLKNRNSAVFIDIGLRNTRIIFFKERKLQLAESFQIGGNDFTWRISDALGMKYKDAENLKESFSKNQLSREVKQRIEKFVLPVLNNWQVKFLKLAGRFKNREIYLFGGGSGLWQIKQIISKTVENSQIKELKISDLPLKNKSGKEISPEEIPILILTLPKIKL